MAESVSENSNARDGMLFQHILLMLQTLALQQLGKITNPITGTVERDLHQARITIDMLGMLQRKTAGNLEEKEKRLLDTVVLELRMNYVDESGKPPVEGEAKDGKGNGGPFGEDATGGDVSKENRTAEDDPDRSDT